MGKKMNIKKHQPGRKDGARKPIPAHQASDFSALGNAANGCETKCPPHMRV